jgi:hypothetical protein
MKRRGMELAINTIVVLVIGVAILGLGLTLVWGIFREASKLPDEVSSAQQEQLFKVLIGSKDKIAVLNNVQSASLKETAIYPVAIRNQLPAPTSDFQILIATPSVVPSGVVCITDINDAAYPNCPVMKALTTTFTVNRYDSYSFYVGLYVPKGTKSGQYVFNVKVQNKTVSGTWDDYALTKIQVKVE